MNYYPSQNCPFYWNTIRAVSVFILSVVFMCKSWRAYSNSRIIENDGTWKVNDFNNCIEFSDNPSPHRLEVECKKRYGSGEYFYLFSAIILFVVAVLQVVYVLKRFFSRVEEFRKEPERRQETAPESTFILTAVVTGNNCNSNLSASSFHNIVLQQQLQTPTLTAVSDSDEPPPEYLPPPTYNECVVNMRE